MSLPHHSRTLCLDTKSHHIAVTFDLSSRIQQQFAENEKEKNFRYFSEETNNNNTYENEVCRYFDSRRLRNSGINFFNVLLTTVEKKLYHSCIIYKDDCWLLNCLAFLTVVNIERWCVIDLIGFGSAASESEVQEGNNRLRAMDSKSGLKKGNYIIESQLAHAILSSAYNDQ